MSGMRGGGGVPVWSLPDEAASKLPGRPSAGDSFGHCPLGLRRPRAGADPCPQAAGPQVGRPPPDRGDGRRNPAPRRGRGDGDVGSGQAQGRPSSRLRSRRAPRPGSRSRAGPPPPGAPPAPTPSQGPSISIRTRSRRERPWGLRCAAVTALCRPGGRPDDYGGHRGRLRGSPEGRGRRTDRGNHRLQGLMRQAGHFWRPKPPQGTHLGTIA
jgi:translation initiation factor IF-2